MTNFDETIRHYHRDGTIREERFRRPFMPFDDKLSDILIRDFVVPALEWLHGQSVGVAPSTLVSAHAEVAMAISATTALLKGRPQLAHRLGYLIEKCATEVVWLEQKATFHDNGTCCFDHSAWDTSTAVRALFDVMNVDVIATEVRQRQASGIDKVIVGGVRWLLSRFNDADRGSLGSLLNPSEYAQIGRALAIVSERYDLDEETRAHTVYADVSEAISRILTILVERRSERMIEIATDDHSTKIATIWWDDFFGTSEVLLFFSTLNSAIRRGSVKLEPSNRTLMRECITKCFLLLEHTQSDGLWGGYLDTVGVLNAYVSISEQSKTLFNEGRDRQLLLAQPRIVFRALRWMCDPTQRSSDGSVLHTAWLTTLFAISLVQVATLWSYADKTVGELYDDLSMAMDRGVSDHRANQVAAILDREIALDKLESVSSQLGQAKRLASYQGWFRSRLLMTVMTVTVGAIGTFFGGTLGHIFSVELYAHNSVEVLSLIGVSSAATLAVVAVIWSTGRPPE